MRPTRTALFAAAAIAFAGFAGLAVAAVENSHVLTITLPDGSVEQIRYFGDDAPKVSVTPGPAAFAPMVSIASPFDADSPFAELQRMSAAMDRQAAALLQQSGGLDLAAFDGFGGLTPVDLSQLPAGAQGYSVVSTVGGAGVCTRSVEYTSAGDGTAPKVVTHTSGDCGEAKGSADPASSAKPAAGVGGGHLISAKAAAAGQDGLDAARPAKDPVS